DAGRQKPIGRILKDMEILSESQLQEALSLQRREGGVLGQILVRLGFVAQEEVLLALAAQIGMTVLDLFELPPEGFEKARDEVAFDQRVPPEDVHPLVHAGPVVKLVDLALATALKAGATEVRFESRSERFQIRYLVDGIFHEMESPPRHLAPPLISRLRLLTALTGESPESATGLAFRGRRYRVDAE